MSTATFTFILVYIKKNIDAWRAVTADDSRSGSQLISVSQVDNLCCYAGKMMKRFNKHKQTGKKKPKQKKTPLAVYSKDEWARMKEICVDPDELGVSFAAWLMGFERQLAMYYQRGMPTTVVHIMADEFMAWCEVEGRPLNRQARDAYMQVSLQENEESMDDSSDVRNPPKEKTMSATGRAKLRVRNAQLAREEEDETDDTI
ncbi:MAG: hypothetical protein AAF639_35585 [Chloroflexota bacterium]